MSMRIKSVVKVMNFYSLLRVDSSKRKAEKYFGYEQAVREFIDNILNNKNLILDKKMIKMNKKSLIVELIVRNPMIWEKVIEDKKIGIKRERGH